MLVQQRSRFIGSALILAGTAIGAGMLALPLVTASLDLTSILIVFFITAFFAIFTAFLTYEVNLSVEPGCNLYTMANRTLGRTGQLLSVIAPLGLFYALMAAYLSGGGGLFQRYFQVFIPELSPGQSILGFGVLSGIFICIGTRAVDYLNRVIFALMILFLLVVLAALLPEVSREHVNLTGNIDSLSLIAAVPVIYTSFGFHGSIPSIILYQNKDYRFMVLIFVIATLIPLTVYCLWLLAVMGTLPSGQLESISQSSGATAGLINALGSKAGGDLKLATSLHLFSDFALLTSLLGVALGLFDYLANLMRRNDDYSGRFQTVLVTFLPPALIAILYPDGFVTALGYAAIALSVLAILLPAVMILTLRKRKQTTKDFRTPGGMGMIVICICYGLIIIASQLVSVI